MVLSPPRPASPVTRSGLRLVPPSAWLLVLALAAPAAVVALAEPVPPTSPTASAPAPAPVPARDPAPGGRDEPAVAGDLRLRSGRIRDLVRGRLDPAVDPSTLFTIDLGAQALGQDPSVALTRLLTEIGGRRRPAGVAPGADEVDAARAELEAALLDFLRRPQAERRRLLDRHQARRQQAQDAERAAAERRARLEATERMATGLAALLDGKLPPNVDPAPLLRVDLLDASEIGADAARRARFLSGEQPGTRPTARQEQGGEAAPESRLAAARLRLDDLRLRWLALSPAQRAELLERHRHGVPNEAARREAERAAEEARLALAEAERATASEALRLAETEGARLAAEERVRLLAAREAQAAAAAGLRKLREEADATRERALGWIRKVRELESRSVLDGDREGDADRAYDRLVPELSVERGALASALDDLASDRTRVPELPARPDVSLDDPDLDRLRADLVATRRRLLELEDGLRWERVSKDRDAVEWMNQVRLRLLGMSSPSKAAQLRGFGPAGVRQAGRELTQIGLELRYHRYWLPRVATARVQAARTAPLPEFVGFAQLAALVLVFRWWRRRAARSLAQLQEHFSSRRPPQPLDGAGWAFAWYLGRVRVPLEWLALVLLLSRFRTVADLPELGYLLLVVAWALGGWLVMKLLDAMASRQGEASPGTAALRWKSLRLGGVTAVGIGLLLSVAERSVGRGALYSWISTAAWIAITPILLILVAWWRPIVLAEVRSRRERGLVLGWVQAHDAGLVSYPAAAVGGLWLLAEGVAGFLSSQTGRLTATRRVLAWLFRRELERQAAAKSEEPSMQPLTEAELRVLDPGRPSAGLVRDQGDALVARARHLAGRAGALLAVVGERGMGKTTLLDRLLDDPSTQGALRVTARLGSFELLASDLSRASGLEWDGSISRLVSHLRELRPPLICIDDVQRIVRPMIGGLAEVDRLLTLARAVGPATSWVTAVGTPGFGFLDRARDGRVTFDEVLRLPPWTVEEIEGLVRDRTREAGLDPSFAGVTVSRAGQAASGQGRHQRTERDFYGLLWDYSGGNPAVALQAWGECLGRNPGGAKVLVHLAASPTAEDLEEFPLNFLFILRAVLQMELATEEDVARCTDLRLPDVGDALRVARDRGFAEVVDGRVRLTLRWYRAVTQALRRRHLIAS